MCPASTSQIEKSLQQFEKGVAVALNNLSKAILREDLRLAALYHIARAMRNNRTVVTLDFSKLFNSKRIKQDALAQREIFAFIAKNILQAKVLKNLILDGSTVSDESAKNLAESLQNAKLTRLSMAFCQFESPQGFFTLLQSINTNKSIQQIDLFESFYPFPVNGLKVTVINQNTSSFETAENLAMLKTWKEKLGDRLTIDEATLELCHLSREDLAESMEFCELRSEADEFILEKEWEQLQKDWRNKPSSIGVRKPLKIASESKELAPPTPRPSCSKSTALSSASMIPQRIRFQSSHHQKGPELATVEAYISVLKNN